MAQLEFLKFDIVNASLPTIKKTIRIDYLAKFSWLEAEEGNSQEAFFYMWGRDFFPPKDTFLAYSGSQVIRVNSTEYREAIAATNRAKVEGLASGALSSDDSAAVLVEKIKADEIRIDGGLITKWIDLEGNMVRRLAYVLNDLRSKDLNEDDGDFFGGNTDELFVKGNLRKIAYTDSSPLYSSAIKTFDIRTATS